MESGPLSSCHSNKGLYNISPSLCMAFGAVLQSESPDAHGYLQQLQSTHPRLKDKFSANMPLNLASWNLYWNPKVQFLLIKSGSLSPLTITYYNSQCYNLRAKLLCQGKQLSPFCCFLDFVIPSLRKNCEAGRFHRNHSCSALHPSLSPEALVILIPSLLPTPSSLKAAHTGQADTGMATKRELFPRGFPYWGVCILSAYTYVHTYAHTHTHTHWFIVLWLDHEHMSITENLKGIKNMKKKVKTHTPTTQTNLH